jgi:hypothetical protein
MPSEKVDKPPTFPVAFDLAELLQWQAHTTTLLEQVIAAVERLEDTTVDRGELEGVRQDLIQLRHGVEQRLQDGLAQCLLRTNQRFSDLGLDTVSAKVIRHEEILATLRGTAAKYGLLSGSGVVVLTFLIWLFRALLTGDFATPPELPGE